jgi:hypothetical protein
MTMNRHTWTITAIGQSDRGASGDAAILSDAWLDALTAGRTALLAGELDTLAVAIDGELEARYTPGRDHAGALDPAEVTEILLRWYQDAIAPGVIAALVDARPRAR